MAPSTDGATSCPLAVLHCQCLPAHGHPHNNITFPCAEIESFHPSLLYDPTHPITPTIEQKLSFGPMSSTTLSRTSTSRSRFQSILSNALCDYTKQTGIDLAKYEFANQIEGCRSPDEVVFILRDKAKKFKEYREGNRKLINWITPIVQVVHLFSALLGEGSAVHFQPGKPIFIGIDLLISAAIGVSSSYDALVDLFECVGSFLTRLSVYTEMPLTDGMMDILVRIMVEVLSVLALATKQIKLGRLKKFAKVLLKGGGDIEAVLQRLDRLTQEEARMTVTQTLEVVYGLVNNMKLVMDNGTASTDGIREALVSMQKTACEVNKIRRDQLQDKVRNWLSPPDPSTNQNIIYGDYQVGTASWFFQGAVFAEWKETGPLLWIHGKPGSGKSTLISSIIQDLNSKRAAGLASVVYYYFDFRDADKQNRQGLISSLLVQLAAESDSCYDILSRLYTTHGSGARKPTDVALTRSLKEMLEHHRQATYIIIDAIDECPNTSGFPTAREKVLECLEGLIDLQLPHLRICVASRPEVDITSSLGPLTTRSVSLHEEKGQKKDILDYITKVVHTDKRMCKWREEDKELVIAILSEKSDGMFRWAFCQLECLRRCFPASIRSAINELPKSLDETYERTLLNIDEEKQEYAQRLFHCLTLSIRPLRVDELAEILAIRFDSDSTPNYNAGWRSGNAEEAVLSACSGLVAVVTVDGLRVVQFSHFSVKEFLTSERLATIEGDLSRYHILPGPAHTFMAKACLSILLKLDDTVDKTTIENSPLALYAAQHWIEHAQFGDVSSRIQDVMFRLFDPDKPHFWAWIWLYDMDRHWENHMSTAHPTRPQASSLYYAALCGFSDLVEHLVRTHPSEINTKGGYHITPLLASLGRGHEKITPLLLREGADVDVRDNDGSTPLHKACRAGNLEAVRLLLTHKADIHARSGKQELPLHLAAGEGETEICRLLIEHGANIYCRDNQEWTPLHCGSRFGHLEVVRMLLDLGVDVDAKKKDDWTALHLASANGKFQVAHMLIQRGAAIEARNDEQETPLDRAAANGHVEVARLLLNSGANVNVVDNLTWTPLHTASRHGYHEIVELLVGSGANVNAETESLKTPLFVACGHGKLEVARILIKGGSNTNARDKEGWTPLHSAIRYGCLDVVRLLLDSGADVNLPKTDQWTPIHIASANGHLDITELLVGRGAIADSRNDKGETPLDRAVLNGFFDIARFLIENGAAVSARDNKGWTPFHTAARCGHIHIAKYLLDRGVAVDDRTENEETSLDLASSNGKLDVVRFLIDNGADIHAKDKKGWNPLHIASRNGYLEVVRMLLDAGAFVDIQNRTQKTPLALASSRGFVEVARLLIKRGADLNAQDHQSWTPLHFASRYGWCDIAQLLLNCGVDVNALKNDLWSSLHLTAANGHVKLSRLLIQRGARVDIRNDKQETPLDRAASNGHTDVARLLIDHGAMINAVDSNGWTPLHTASHGGHLKVVMFLLRRGANVEAVNEDKKSAEDVALERSQFEVASFLAEHKTNADVRNETHLSILNLAQIHFAAEKERKERERITLHKAAEAGKVEIVRAFLDKGEDVNSETANNKTALDLAAAKGNLDVVLLLIERGADVDSRDSNGWTPLHKAARHGYLQVSRELIIHGANVNATKQDHWTPMHLSARNGHLEVVRLLLERGADVRASNDEGRTPYQLALGKGHQKVADLLQEYERGELAAPGA